MTKTASTYGTIFHDKNDNYGVDEGEAVGKTRVGLRDVITGRVTAYATSDAAGRLDFTNVPVGRYAPQVFGPWTPRDDWHIEVAAEPYLVPFGSLRVVPRHS
ncbi:hypothetical protein [Kibdelosporangium philippinense]|uniref:hypothetical protein n=1 Tax=Kibdelosporangium philippinense TaxID=211113 RepID=UPI0020220C93|nr:hypothetical protein [Kibdelosporangium philippinense]